MNYAEVQQTVNNLYNKYRNYPFNEVIYKHIIELIADFETYYQERILKLQNQINKLKEDNHDG